MKINVVLLVFILFSINSVVEDIRSFRVRTNELMLGILAVTIVKLMLGDTDWMSTLSGGSIGGLALAFVRRLSMGRLGSGDVVFSALVGVSFGFWAWDACILISAFLGAAWIGVRRLSSPGRPSIWIIRIPFAPFMFAGAIAVAIYRGLSQ